MARIIENLSGGRRTIKLSAEDVISVVQAYQSIVRCREYTDVISVLQDSAIFLPEDV